MAIHWNNEYAFDDQAAFEKFSGTLRKERKNVTSQFLPDQEHMTHDGKIVVSHLLALPKGEQPNEALKKLFTQHPFDPTAKRGKWNAISDEDLAAQMPDHNIWWICRANYLPAALVKEVVDAALKTSTAPRRVINNAIPVG